MVLLHEICGYVCAIECTCCRELPEVEEHFEEKGASVISLEAFKTVVLRQDVLYTMLVTVRGDEVKTPIGYINCVTKFSEFILNLNELIA